MDKEIRVEEKAKGAHRPGYRQGVLVLIGLAVLTGLEFVVAQVTNGSVVFMMIIALLKAGLILQYYMHVRRLWGDDEEAH